MNRSIRQSLQLTRSLIVGVSLLLGATACSGSGDEENPTLLVLADESERTLAGLEQDGRTFMERVVDAPKTVAFTGRRRLTLAPMRSSSIATGPDGHSIDGDSEFSNPGHRTVYLETVWSDGSGQFTVTPIDLLEPFLPLDETEQFLLLQQQRERFLYLHRDFQVRDLKLFRQNWRLAIQDSQAEFLGRTAVVARVDRLGDALRDRHYEVTFDAETGLVLAYRELDSMNRPLAVVEYESFELISAGAFQGFELEDVGGEDAGFALTSTVADPSGSESTDAEAPGTPLVSEDFSESSMAEARESLSFRGLQVPATSPTGFRLTKKAVLTDPFGSRWLRLIYSDGVEELFVAIEFERHPQSPVGIQTPILPADGHAGDPTERREDWVEVFSSGNWTVAQGEFRFSSVLAVGKMHHRELLAMLQSALQ